MTISFGAGVCSDYNYVRHGSSCVPVGPEPIPAGICKTQDQTYQGSSGYRIIPGNTCDRNRGVKKDDPIEKKCSQGDCLAYLDVLRRLRVIVSTAAQPEEGNVVHQTVRAVELLLDRMKADIYGQLAVRLPSANHAICVFQGLNDDPRPAGRCIRMAVKQ